MVVISRPPAMYGIELKINSSVPESADDSNEEGDFRLARTASLEKVSDSDIVTKDDPRLRRLADSRVDNREEVRADHRPIRRAEINVSVNIEEEEEARRQQGLEPEEEDEDALGEKRRKN
ncbi:hypothetical protein L6164_003178 [Bauhinia variegata]|uniref:Uncharacterized protein n=1 Tax=Bauhinia variegata TaxID=167791 RepID=A0ACB9Q2I8_BAUVA|nr:hypothetical protein L6164_003178 [Bauhinia variegata]